MPISEQAKRPRTYLTNATEQTEISQFIQAMERQFGDTDRATLTSSSGEVVDLPEKLFDVLRQVADALASGRGVSVIPQDIKLTTQQAAEFLGISRPTLIKLLETEILPYELVGRHRRVTLRDLLEYQDTFRLRRRTLLRQAARAGQETGMLELTSDDMLARGDA